MELEISNHKKADLSTLRKTAKKIIIPLLGITLSLSLFSGCGLNKNIDPNFENNVVVEQTIQVKDNITIPSEYQTYFSYYGYEIKPSYNLEELKQIKVLDITIREDNDLSWINSCVNLESLSITLHSNGDNLKQIGHLNNLKKVSLSIMPIEGYSKHFNVENLSFIKNNKSINFLSLGDSFDSANNQNIFNYLCDEISIENLSITMGPEDNIDFTKMKSLKNLDFKNSKPYDLAIVLHDKVLDQLKSNGVNITAQSGVLEKTLEINQELNNIVEVLNIKENSTDKEKMDAILIYILDNFSYDEQVAYNSYNNTKDLKLNQSFYENGALDAVFNNNGNIICGNYAALFKALANRCGLDTYYIISENHAWNLVSVEGEYYYVDSTWLGEKTFSHITFDMKTQTSNEQIITVQDKIKSGDTEGLSWYMENPNEAINIDSSFSHDAINMPFDIDTSEVIDLNEKEYRINIGTKEYIISGTVLIGLLSGIGIAIKVKNNNKKKYYEDDYSSGKTFL